MPEYQTGNVKIDDIKIHYHRSGGKKPPIILLHGVSDSGLCWDRVAQALSENYDVILPDVQGHGLSGRIGQTFSYQDHTRQIAGLIKALKLTMPVVMGHSMGAGTAADLAAEYPAMIKAIIMEDPPWSAVAPHPQNPKEAEKMHQELLDMFGSLGKRRIQDILIEKRKTDPTWAEEDRVPWATAKKQFDKNIFRWVVVNPHPYEEIVVKIKCPTLLITAGKSFVTEETVKKIAALWKAKSPYRWVRIEGAGHNIRREQFTAYMKAVEEFLIEAG